MMLKIMTSNRKKYLWFGLFAFHYNNTLLMIVCLLLTMLSRGKVLLQNDVFHIWMVFKNMIIVAVLT